MNSRILNHFLTISSPIHNREEMKEASLLCKKTNDIPNPIFDYYHAQILATPARLIKHQTAEKK